MSTSDQNTSNGQTPMAPPPFVPDGAAPAAASAAPSPRGKGIMIATAVVGGIALLGSGGTAAFAAVGDLSRSDSVQSIGVSGIDSLDLEVGASDFTVRFGDVDDAELTVTSGRGGAWTLERDEDELVVRSPRAVFGWWFGNWFGTDESVVLTLPGSLRSAAIDADVTLNAGSLDMSGDFGELDIEVGAGSLRLEGSASTVDAEVNAGRAQIELDGVRTADLTVAAGRLNAELTGSALDSVVLDVSAGSLDITVPDREYNLTVDRSAGSLDSSVDESSRSSRTIDATVEAGSITIRPGG